MVSFVTLPLTKQVRLGQVRINVKSISSALSKPNQESFLAPPADPPFPYVYRPPVEMGPDAVTWPDVAARSVDFSANAATTSCCVSSWLQHGRRDGWEKPISANK